MNNNTTMPIDHCRCDDPTNEWMYPCAYCILNEGEADKSCVWMVRVFWACLIVGVPVLLYFFSN